MASFTFTVEKVNQQPDDIFLSFLKDRKINTTYMNDRAAFLRVTNNKT